MFEEFFGSGAVDVGKGINIAISLEKRGMEYYASNARNAGSTEGATLFRFLEGEERKHLKSLQELALARGGESAGWADALAASAPGLFRLERGRGGGARADILGAAMETEKASIEFYSKFAERIEAPEGKRFFRALAGFEETHLALLSALMEKPHGGEARV
ncbi:MAG: ferritin family protein [Candidatus ainarchaeum sp.]|nr:ferritin family protein [Candidatus ainarchaeum sp.]